MSDATPKDAEAAVDALASLTRKPVSARRGALERRVSGALNGAIERTSWEGCRRIGSILGLTFFTVGKRRRELAISNLQMALGMSRAQAQRAARRSAQNWGMTTCEFLHIPAASPQEIRDYVSLDGLEHLQSTLEAGRGAVILTAHLGNWELLGARLAQETSVAGVVRPLSNETMQAKMSGVRRGYGLELISKHAAARPSLKCLRRNDALFILPDRHAGPEGVLLPLFGRVTRFESAPARMAQMSGALILPTWGVRRGPWLSNGRINARILPGYGVPNPSRAEREDAVLDGTRQVIASLEDIVRQHPDQWSWMLRRWRDDDALGQNDN
jgi:KDO2-lipid IV(A) lauroyltransferase